MEGCTTLNYELVHRIAVSASNEHPSLCALWIFISASIQCLLGRNETINVGTKIKCLSLGYVESVLQSKKHPKFPFLFMLGIFLLFSYETAWVKRIVVPNLIKARCAEPF